ncbi:MAG TPA: phage tail protein [Allosphingosinicella sp.]|jgi:hypothetical protein
MTIRGAGGGKSGGKPRTPIEAPDSLRSVSFARVLDLLSEGEVFGPVDPLHPLRCIYLNETPIENSDGTMNFKSVQVEIRTGTQVQDYIKGFESTENENPVNVEITSDQSWTQNFVNTDVDAVRIRLSTPSLYIINTENGDQTGHSFSYAIDMNVDGGGFVTKFESAVTGKTTSKYQRSHRVELPKFTTGVQLRVRRTSPSSNKSNISDGSFIDAFAELVDVKLRYPMSALVGLTLAAEQFSSVPSRAYHWKGRLIKVPINYNPETRQYTGLWNGTFKTAYSNNPAWAFYDMATNTRYGLGKRVPAAMVDKWTLYAIGQYCDELVPDGFGNMEPRFTCNMYLQTRNDATKTMQDMATVFRGMMYVAGGTLVPSCDKPADVRYHFAPANVIDGKFTYMGSSQKARHTLALVSWNDMSNFGRQKIEPVQADDAAIARFGIRQIEVAALGCTSRGQAHRLGKYILLTEQYETDTVTFDVGLEGNIPAPGDIIEIADPLRAGSRMGGRVLVSGLSTLTLDEVPDVVGNGDVFKVILPNGMPETRTITGFDLVANTVTLNAPLSAEPVRHAVWLIESASINAQTFRVLAVAEKPGIQFSITALQYVPSKFGAIELGLSIDEPPIGSNGDIPDAITGLRLTSFMRYGHNIAFNVLNADWENAKNASRYGIQWRKNNGPWTTPQKVTDSNFDFEGPFAGTYVCRVWGENFMGIPGPSVQSDPFVVTNAVMPARELSIGEGGVVDVDCNFVQFVLVLTQNVTRFNFINVGPQDSIIVDIRNTGNFTVNFGNKVIPIEGFQFTMPQGEGAFAVIGMTTMDAGVSWLLKTAAQTANDIYPPLIATINPSPASGTWSVPNSGPGAPSVQVAASAEGGDGTYSHEWFRVDGEGGDNFLISNAAVTNPTFSIPAGTTAYGGTQTWRYRVTDGLLAQGTADVSITLTRAVATPFGISTASSHSGSCFANAGQNVGCSPTTEVQIAVVGATYPITWSITRTDGLAQNVGQGVNPQTAGNLFASFSLSSGTSNAERQATYRVDATDALGTPASCTFTVNLARSNEL